MNKENTDRTKLSSIPGLLYQKVPGDGHCLFHAVGLHVNEDQAFLRRIVAAHLEHNKNEFRQFIQLPVGQTIEDYIKAIKEGKEWADHIEIEVLMRVLDRPIIVIGNDLIIRNRDVLEKGLRGEPIFVLYNGHNHYDAFLKAEGTSIQDILVHLNEFTEQSSNIQKNSNDTNVLIIVNNTSKALSEISNCDNKQLKNLNKAIKSDIDWSVVLHSVIPERSLVKYELTDADIKYRMSIEKRNQARVIAGYTAASTLALGNVVLQSMEAYSAFASKITKISTVQTVEVVKTIIYRQEWSWRNGWINVPVDSFQATNLSPDQVTKNIINPSWFSGSKILAGVSWGLAIYTTVSTVYNIYSSVQKMKQEQKKIKNLADNIEQAIRSYDERKFRNTIEVLSQDLGGGDRILIFDPTKDTRFLEINNIIKRLLAAGFSPDGIGYILFMIADCLMSRQMGDISASTNVMDQKARELLELIIEDDSLIKQAEELDRNSKDYFDSNFISKWYKWARYNANENLYQQIKNNPISIRLNMIKLIAKINLILLYLLDDDPKIIQRARDMLRSIEEDVNLLDSGLRDRFAKLKEFMAIFGYDKFNKENLTDISEPNTESDKTYLRITFGQEYEARQTYLKSVRKIRLVKSQNKYINYCEVIPAEPDGNCVFTAINNVLAREGVNLNIRRDEFINAVGQKDQEMKNDPSWELLLKEIYKDAKTDHYKNWKLSFCSPEYRLNEAHIKVISKLYNLRFQIARLPNSEELGKLENSEIFVPYSGVTHEIWCGSGNPQLIINLIQIPLQEEGKNYIIHYEGLYLYSNEEALMQISKKINDHLEDKNIYQILRDRGICYYQKALKELKENRNYDAYRHWKFATDDFIAVNKAEQLDIEGYFYLIESLIHLSKFNDAQKYIHDVAEENKKKYAAKYHFLYGIICLKLKNYETALLNFMLAYRHGYDKHHVQRKINRCKHLKTVNSESKVELINIHKKYQEYYNTYNIDLNMSGRSSEKEPYRILSIDGGGIRGIIPAIWLSEIERRTHRPIAQTFNLLSGTSTGGILAAGLNVKKPFSKNGHFTADELTAIYTTRAYEIFSPPTGIFGRIKKYKFAYGSEGITNILNEYFGSNKITDCTSDLLITSVETSDLYNTFTFTKQKAINNTIDNYSLVDVLRATSAAPTFFPVHKLSNKCFVDGGVRSNNPAYLACEYAEAQNKDTRDIMMVSLGTGEYIPEPIIPTYYNGLLFWANKITDLTMAGQEYNTHLRMQKYFNEKKPNRYFRFQAQLNDIIPLDEQRPSKLKELVDIAHESLEEAYAEENNSMNKLLESLSP